MLWLLRVGRGGGGARRLLGGEQKPRRLTGFAGERDTAMDSKRAAVVLTAGWSG